jgi:hypothetical protein
LESNLAFVPDGTLAVARDLRSAQTRFTLEVGAREIVASSFASEVQMRATLDQEGRIDLWRDGNQKEPLLSLIVFRNGHWLATTPSGLYDSSSPGDLPTVSWVLPSDPLTPLPVESFMKEYYEPGLLGKVLRGEPLREVKALGELNRVQPRVEVVSVTPEGDGRQVTVTVEIGQGCRRVGVDAEAKEVCTKAVHDLRLFRDGQLVRYAPQQSGPLDLGKDGQQRLRFEHIPVPTDGREAVEFSAYAFNEDGVKSLTAKRSYALPRGLKPRTPRAYVVSVGMNAYQNRAWDLQYAARDAEEMQAQLGAALRGSGRYREVVRVPLISTRDEKSGELQRSVTKAQLRTVFALLAGQPVSEADKAGIENVEKLQRAQPEDLLLISYAGHGMADAEGQFYLFPWDIGGGAVRAPIPPQKLISSEELSEWLRDVDAGEQLFILDACQSAASVQGKEFRPGPMGSRGLGQLAYDKGMRLLAASQAEFGALEHDDLRHGVLTYALLEDGLAGGEADFEPEDAQILAGEWLRYGEQQVPQLYEALKSGTFRGRDGYRFEIELPPDDAPQQQPVLFDFRRGVQPDPRLSVAQN